MSGTGPWNVDLPFLVEAYQRLNRALELETCLEMIRTVALEGIDAEAVNLLLWEEDRAGLEFLIAFNRIGEPARRIMLHPGEGLASWVAENDRPALVNDLRDDTRYTLRQDREYGFRAHSALAVPLHRGRSVMGVLELLNGRGDPPFGGADFRLLEALTDPVAVALENALLYRGLQREKAENEVIYQISSKLNQTLDLPETLDRILELVGEVIPFHAGGIALVHDTDPVEIEMVSYRGYPPGAEERFPLKVGQGAIGWVIHHEEPLRIPDVQRDPRYVDARPQTRSELAAPMFAEGRVVGAFNLEHDQEDAYRARHVRLIRSFASHAALSVQRARLHREVLRRQRLLDEVETAREIQKRLLPSQDPVLPGFEASGGATPSLEVGGDSFDLIRINTEQVGLLVGDVAGKGIPAAFILSSFWAAMRSEVRHNYEIRRILRNVNRLLWESTRVDQFVTAFYGVLDLSRRRLTYANAGHDPPILLREGGAIERLEAGGLLLGVLEDAAYEEAFVEIGPGDLLLLYTDGAVEARGPDGEEFGEERLIETLRLNRARRAPEIRVALEAAILRHCEGKAQDDVTLVVVKG
ncbi:MAG: SpoIIE family protein phosphatase [Candidatus Eisenbacteria bacterium]|nr:SpoIIE family protein phosphatase [Candidatus Latescibacterota bacterium]MBD3302768.1 SpoIIE family protein phosphatase [Candidatus Eisenbacteria bacterium]